MPKPKVMPAVDSPAERKLPPARPRVRPPRIEGTAAEEEGVAAPAPKAPIAAQPAEHDYKIGFKRPPLHSRFKAGNNANPKGRPKKSRSLMVLLEEELDAKVVARIGGKTVTLTARQAAAKQLAAKVVAGDKTAVALWLRYESLRQDPGEAPAVEAALSEEEAASLEAYLRRLDGSADEEQRS